MRTKRDMWLVTGDKKERATREEPSCHVSRVTCHRQRGVALVITLILLGVVTFMAVAFLALSRRERGAVSTVTDTAGARLAADAALADAEAQIMASVLATTNPFGFGLIVSTNYINPIGFQSGVSSFTNVNYSYSNGVAGASLSVPDLLQNLTNLWYRPRPPVFVVTNALGSNDFRYYLDLNRNGRDDPNGSYPVISMDPNNPYYSTNGNLLAAIGPTTLSNVLVGDPEWIGVLERPDAPYGPNNKFVARYAFVAVPVGNALDLNAIYNQVNDEPNKASASPISVNPPASLTAVDDCFFRNQGVGSWELNLAAFLVDLSTNQWGQVVGNALNGNATWYYYQNQPGINRGHAFDDARALLAYRYANNYNTLYPAFLTLNGAPGFFSDNIDGYSDGPLQTTLGNINESLSFPDLPGRPWAGANNTNHFFTHQELFDTSKTAVGVTPLQLAGRNDFTDRLLNTGTNVSTADRYAFYRLLSQLGTDSAADAGKMNLNYVNVDANGNVVPGMETNGYRWTNSLQFFTNAADRLLRAYTTQWRNSNPTNFAMMAYGVPPDVFTNVNFITNSIQWTNYPAFGIGHIPVWVSNRFVYSPSVNRLLQLAANLYDASTNGFLNGANLSVYAYPSVFRPLFSRDVSFGGVAGMGTNLYISGFTNVFSVEGPADFRLALPLEAVDLADPNFVKTPVIDQATNVYGVPWIIGAKKGFPSFNELAMENAFQIERKVQATRPTTNSPVNTYSYNQMYLLDITNQLGVEFWNSYTNSFTNAVVLYANNVLRNIVLTNDENFRTNLGFISSGSLSLNTWGGYDLKNNPLGVPASFQIPLNTSLISITNSMYRFNSGGTPFLTTNLGLPYETGVNINGSLYPQPHWWLAITNDLQVYLLGQIGLNNYRVIDYAQLRGPNSFHDLSSEIINTYTNGGLWLTNITANGQPYGIGQQIAISLAILPNWTSFFDQTDLLQATNAVNAFRVFWHLSPLPPSQQAQFGWVTTTNNIQAAYNPVANIIQHISWQANDPLVHYVSEDLNWAGASRVDSAYDLLTAENLGQLNQRYMPWGGNPLAQQSDQYPYYPAIKDPLVWRSDDWDFPTNEFPSVGWMGRVHRGTPWQTVYLKASDVLSLVQTNFNSTNYLGMNLWTSRTGNDPTNASYTTPVQDRLLFDLFTTAFNDNATRGTLSVNVGPTNANLAAWSALLSGMVVLSNNAPDVALTGQLDPQHANTLTNYTALTNQPAGVYDPATPLLQQPALARIVQGINSTRANTNLFPRQAFAHVGDILSVPQLTEQSPYLNWRNDAVQQTYGINDEMYEWLPQQMMSLLRCPQSPRYVIYCYGQALKPAPNGVFSSGSGQFFNLVTNYQVVSEIATRAVVRFDAVTTNLMATNIVFVGTPAVPALTWATVPAVTNNRVVIEQFNILPPD